MKYRIVDKIINKVVSKVVNKKKIGLITASAAVILLSGCAGSNSFADPVEEEPTLVESGAVAAVSQGMRGVGTEPFRGFTVADNTIERRIPADEGGIKKTTFVGVNEISSGSTYLFEDTNKKISITALSGSCDDGMSDYLYPYQVEVAYDQQEFTGCGELNTF